MTVKKPTQKPKKTSKRKTVVPHKLKVIKKGPQAFKIKRPLANLPNKVNQLPDNFALISSHGVINLNKFRSPNNKIIKKLPDNIHLWLVAPTNCLVKAAHQIQPPFQTPYDAYINKAGSRQYRNDIFLRKTANTIKDERRLLVHYEFASFRGPGQEYIDMDFRKSSSSDSFKSGIYYKYGNGKTPAEPSFSFRNQDYSLSYLIDVISKNARDQGKQVVIIVHACRVISTIGGETGQTIMYLGNAPNFLKFKLPPLNLNSISMRDMYNFSLLKSIKDHDEKYANSRAKYFKKYALYNTHRGPMVPYESESKAYNTNNNNSNNL